MNAIRTYVALSDLRYDSQLELFATMKPDVAILQAYLPKYGEDGTLEDHSVSPVWLTVYDAMRLREGLDAFISQAVGADV